MTGPRVDVEPSAGEWADVQRRRGVDLARRTPEKAAGYRAAVAAGTTRRTAAVDLIVAGIEDGLAEAARCRECGRELTDPDSIEAGIGPDCAAKLEEADRG